MGYIIEPTNVDLVVGPSVLTEESKKMISDAIALYRKTGKQPVSIPVRQIEGSTKKSKQINSSGKAVKAEI